jgi:hypothetical protein
MKGILVAGNTQFSRPVLTSSTQGRNWGQLDQYHQPAVLDPGLRSALELALGEGVSTARSKYRSQLLKEAKRDVQHRMSQGEVSRGNRDVEVDKIVRPKMAEFERRLQLAGPVPSETNPRAQDGRGSTPLARSNTDGIGPG